MRDVATVPENAVEYSCHMEVMRCPSLPSPCDVLCISQVSGLFLKLQQVCSVLGGDYNTTAFWQQRRWLPSDAESNTKYNRRMRDAARRARMERLRRAVASLQRVLQPMARSWEALPLDVVALISQFMTSAVNVCNVSLVCRGWADACAARLQQCAIAACVNILCDRVACAECARLARISEAERRAEEAARLAARAQRRVALNAMHAYRKQMLEGRIVYHRHDLGSAREAVEVLHVRAYERKGEISCSLHVERYTPHLWRGGQGGSRRSATAGMWSAPAVLDVNDLTLEEACCDCVDQDGHACAFCSMNGPNVKWNWCVAEVRLKLKDT